MLRTIVAALLASLVLVLAGAPHAHAAADANDCIACVTRTAEAAAPAAPDVAPRVVNEAAVAARPARSPVTGAPLGAVPGQSPPVA